MKSFFPWLKENRALLEAIQGIASRKRVTLYLVGGALRDIVSGRQKNRPDMDFCLKQGAISFARAVARELKCGFVVLDELHGCARAVKKMRGGLYTLDFTDFRGKTLEEDLLHRDFSVNSMALELKNIFSLCNLDDALIDPFGGRKDIKAGIVRLVNRQGFDEDPLRLLRAFSLAALFGFSLDPLTSRLARSKRKKITSVASERVRDELFKVLSSRQSFGPLKKIEEYGLLDLIIPEIKPMRRIRQGLHHHLDVWNHSLETFKHLEAILNKAKDANTMSSYIAEEVSAGRSRYELIKLAGLLHDIGKPGTLSVKRGKVSFHGHERLGACMCEKIGIRLKLSNEEIRCLKQIVFSHLRPGFLADAPLLTRRARFRFFRDTGSEALSVLLVSLADQRATKGRLATRESRQRHERLIKRLMREYFTGRNEKKAKRLVNGNDLMDRFGLKPSPAIGKVLRELEELQAIGRIKNRREALRHAAKILKKS